MDNFFNPAGDLTDSFKNEKKVEQSKNADKYFTQGGDLTDSPIEEKPTTITNMDQIQNYINSIVSGTKFPDECDLAHYVLKVS